MPSVGMRRTTRVFGVVKGVEGRVLRSGRRLWSDEASKAKLRKNNDAEWLSLIDNKGGDGNVSLNNSKRIGWSVDKKPSSNNEEKPELKSETQDRSYEKPEAKPRELEVGKSLDKRFVVVYSRKRKRESVQNSEKSDLDSDKKFGICFSRREKRRSYIGDCNDGSEGDTEECLGSGSSVVKLASGHESSVFCRILFSVLRYMRRGDLKLPDFKGFVVSEPIFTVYASRGIEFLRDSDSLKGSGFCKLFGTRQFIPMFSVDYTAVALNFMYLHLAMFLKYNLLSSTLVYMKISGETIDMHDEKLGVGDSPCLPSESKTVAGKVDAPSSKLVLHLPVKCSKTDPRTSQYRYGLHSRGARKTRSSFRSRRRRNLSVSMINKTSVSSALDSVNTKKNGLSFYSSSSSTKLRRSVRGRSAGSSSDKVMPVMAGFRQDMDSSSCTANLLSIDSEKGIREEGANILLEASDAGEWFIVIKLRGIMRFIYKASEVIKPSFLNRFTHAMVWAGDNGWKLEFTNKDDWLKFKELCRECVDRNKQVVSPVAAAAKNIPVPIVQEVPGYCGDDSASFSRPDSYIIMFGDEVSRAMVRKTANYDMDDEDEEWLEKFNKEFFSENKVQEHVLPERFELMIDAFEKAFYCNPHDLSSDKLDSNIYVDEMRKDIVEAVYGYWIEKRKQKRAALVRAFQCLQVRKAPLVPRPAFRKKRSFKRQPSQPGRGKQTSVLQVLAAARDAQEERNALRNLEEAKASADRSIEVAVTKRRRAQLLMDNADLAAYRAAMALRIAEIAQNGESLSVACTHFLDS